MNDNNHSPDKSLVRSTGQSLTAVRSDLIKRGLSLINTGVKTVLIVDDDEGLLRALKTGLKRNYEFFSVITASGGEIAFDILKKHSIALVITDLNMPKCHGFELADHIMKMYPHIPVILMTGAFCTEYGDIAYSNGISEFIAKPFMIDDLVRKIIIPYLNNSFNNSSGSIYRDNSLLGKFFLMLKIDGKKYTIIITNKKTGQIGNLFFKCYYPHWRSGELLDAQTLALRGNAAMREIFSWDIVSVSIQNECPVNDKKIQGDFPVSHARLGDAESYYNLGKACLEIECSFLASQAFNEAIRIKPDFAEAHFNLGIAYSQLEDKDSALREYGILKTLDIDLANKLLAFKAETMSHFVRYVKAVRRYPR